MFDWILIGVIYTFFVVLLAMRHMIEAFTERNAGPNGN